MPSLQKNKAMSINLDHSYVWYLLTTSMSLILSQRNPNDQLLNCYNYPSGKKQKKYQRTDKSQGQAEKTFTIED